MKNALLFLTAIIVITSCKEETQPTCGCKSETLLTIPSEQIQKGPNDENISGKIFYKRPENKNKFLNDEAFDYRFWIFQGLPGCGNCQRHFIICNENLLKGQFDYLIQDNSSDSIAVKFSGRTKLPCGEPFVVLADYFYAEIVLTSIELDN